VVDHIIAPLYHHAVFGLGAGSGYAATLVSDVFAMAACAG
jgi:protein-L-isoaspartate O-methyltransferase